MPLVINSLGGRHTHTNTHTDIRTETILRTRHAPACGGHALGLKRREFCSNDKKILYALGLKTSCITTELSIIIYLSTVYITCYSHIITGKRLSLKSVWKLYSWYILGLLYINNVFLTINLACTQHKNTATVSL